MEACVSDHPGAVWGLPLSGANAREAEPGNLPSEDSISPPCPGRPEELSTHIGV